MKHIMTAAALALAPLAAWAEGQVHKIAVQVNHNDPHTLNMALNNVRNLYKYYESQGDSAEVEIVAYGPGLQMFIDGASPVGDRISTMALEHSNLKFSACGNTIAKMSKKAGKDIALMDEAGVVPSGVVRLVELQQQGFAYVRP
jgi:intracellular sulfur oxidation DsrE/DsrF family protein